jgi:hypothetical protein
VPPAPNAQQRRSETLGIDNEAGRRDAAATAGQRHRLMRAWARTVHGLGNCTLSYIVFIERCDGSMVGILLFCFNFQRDDERATKLLV